MLKRGYHGTYHHMSEKHLNRYVNEFAGRHNDRPSDTLDQMATVARGMAKKRLSVFRPNRQVLVNNRLADNEFMNIGLT